MSIRDDVLQQALALSPEDRAHLAGLLEKSLIQHGGFATPEIAQAWNAEIERRAQAYDHGQMPADDWKIALARMQSRLDTRNS